ncbi:UPF0481 protein At3g47200-like [Impatiens glandulifera]|uniref:UPF0481 protein At3g47200-like n=1 Tax=Impatiens glandulifera TaxID=253017 RepID=UPI001FB09C64|nr:UPF0481 protein At3g47200-like [Impatiens glandulifera]
MDISNNPPHIGDENHNHRHDHVDQRSVEVWEINIERLESMQKNISTTPNLLTNWSGNNSCSIFRVPHSFVQVNGHSSYHPHIVSIGPFHHGHRDLQMIQQHKWRFLGDLINRTNITLEQLLRSIHPLETKARDSYSELIDLTSDEFIELLVLDGCFIIEFFRKICKIIPVKTDDPLISMSWVNSFFLRDLIRIENQIPFFVLQTLFDLTNTHQSNRSLSSLALEFFENSIQRPDEILKKYSDLNGKHLLDLLRKTFIPTDPNLEEPKNSNKIPSHVIQCISKLRKAGIAIKPGKGESFLQVKFRNGTLEMPTITIDAFMICFIVNCVAFEQCQRTCSKQFTTYTALLDYLVNTYKDVEYLCEENVIENYFGTDGEVAKLINNLGKEVSFDLNRCYLSKLFKEVDDYYKNNWHVTWETFRYSYFSSPWSAISAFAATLLLILSLLQTIYAILTFYQSPAPGPRL